MAGRVARDATYLRAMITRTLALVAVSTLLLSASASAAEPGSYSGTSVNKEIYFYGDIDPRTDKGKATFKVKSNAVKKFKLSKQQFMCGATTAEIAVEVAKMELNSAGKGKGSYSEPSVGAFDIKIKVRDNGKASGSITPTGLCRGKVTFTAKLK
jgi:hypothetical protein